MALCWELITGCQGGKDSRFPKPHSRLEVALRYQHVRIVRIGKNLMNGILLSVPTLPLFSSVYSFSTHIWPANPWSLKNIENERELQTTRGPRLRERQGKLTEHGTELLWALCHHQLSLRRAKLSSQPQFKGVGGRPQGIHEYSLISPLLQPCEVNIIKLILEMGQMRFREGEWFGKGHAVSTGRAEILNPMRFPFQDTVSSV